MITEDSQPVPTELPMGMITITYTTESKESVIEPVHLISYIVGAIFAIVMIFICFKKCHFKKQDDHLADTTSSASVEYAKGFLQEHIRPTNSTEYNQ